MQNKLSIATNKVKGIKERTAIAVDHYLSLLAHALEQNSLLEAVSNKVRVAAPEQYKQVKFNDFIRAKLQALGLVKPANYAISVLVPTHTDSPTNIQNFKDSSYGKTVICITNPIIIDGVMFAENEFLKVTKVERQLGIIHFIYLRNDSRIELDISSPTFRDALNDAAFFYESSINISAGDIVYSISQPGVFYEVVSVDADNIYLIDMGGQSIVIGRGSLDSRMLSLAYATFGTVAEAYNSESTIVVLNGDEKGAGVKSFVSSMKQNSSLNLAVYSGDKILRKSLQILCPTDMTASIDLAVEQSGLDYKSYVEWLIDTFVESTDSAEISKDTYIMLYSSPPFSKAHAFWISEIHYEMLRDFCEDIGLKVNRLAFHLIVLDLLKRDLIKLDQLYL
jgi:hypothetical protein